jgi:hypothetical protein
MSTPLTLVKGIGPATAEKLATAGINNAEDLAATTREQLAGIPGFGPARADQILANASQLIVAAKPGGDGMVSAGETALSETEKVKTKALKKKSKPKAKAKKKKTSESKKPTKKKQAKKDKQNKDKKQPTKNKTSKSKKKAKKKKK